jgi:hypothetical protein
MMSVGSSAIAQNVCVWSRKHIFSEHVSGTKIVDREFISAARDRHLLHKAGADQDQAICWFARFEDRLRSPNVFDWSAEECGTERASHQVRQHRGSP